MPFAVTLTQLGPSMNRRNHICRKPILVNDFQTEIWQRQKAGLKLQNAALRSENSSPPTGKLQQQSTLTKSAASTTWRQPVTAECTSTAENRYNSRGTAVHSEVAEELGQGHYRQAEGRGRSHHKLAVWPCRTLAPKTYARDASTLQIHLRWTHTDNKQVIESEIRQKCNQPQQITSALAAINAPVNMAVVWNIKELLLNVSNWYCDTQQSHHHHVHTKVKNKQHPQHKIKCQELH